MSDAKLRIEYLVLCTRLTTHLLTYSSLTSWSRLIGFCHSFSVRLHSLQCHCPASLPPTPPRPNIVFILADAK